MTSCFTGVGRNQPKEMAEVVGWECISTHDFSGWLSELLLAMGPRYMW